MRRYFVIIMTLTMIFALLTMTNAAAQISWEGGIKGGVNLAKLYGDDLEGLEYKLGFVGGAFVTANITEMFGVQIEGLYTQKGAKESDDTTSVELKAKYDYIEFPVLAVVSFDASEKMAVKVFAGPALAILISAKAGAAQGDVALDADVKDYIKNYDFGGVIGAGIAYDFGSATFILEGRYTLGFMTTADLSPSQQAVLGLTENPSEKNSVISIMGGFSLPFGAAAE